MLNINPSNNIDKIRTSLSNKFIGYGGKCTITYEYSTQINKYIVNCEDYFENDIVFVSIVGNEGNEKVRKFHQNKVIQATLLALDSGSTILCNSRNLALKNDCNEGEKRLFDTLEQSGEYIYDEIIRDGVLIGRWSGKRIKLC